jgi:hypothetical protein
VVGIKLTWARKNADELKAAYRELQAAKVGRKARIKGTVEQVVPPLAMVADAAPETHASPPARPPTPQAPPPLPDADTIERWHQACAAWEEGGKNGPRPRLYDGAVSRRPQSPRSRR